MNWIYWKVVEENRKWQLARNNEQSRRIAIKQGAMFFTWMSFSEPYKGNGDPEPVRCGPMPLDFDCKTDVSIAHKQMRELCLVHLPELYDIDPYEIEFYLSGGKGFHAILPAKLFNTEDGDPRLPLIYKKIATQWIEQFNLSTLDMALYNMGHGRMLRIANVKRRNGNYKVPLTLDEVQGCPTQELIAMGKSPRTIERQL